MPYGLLADRVLLLHLGAALDLRGDTRLA